MRHEVDAGRAWAVLGAATLALFVAFGIAYSYGQFLTPLSQAFGVGTGAGSVLFSVTTLVFFCLGALTGPLSDRFGLRPILGLGAGVLVAGLLGTSVATSPWEAYACYGLGVGIGVGCLFVPVVSAVGRWFERLRATATGIAVSGIGLGTVAAPPLIAWQVETLGWRAAFRWTALAALVLLALAIAALTPPPRAALEPTARERQGAPDAERPAFRWLYASALLVNCALYVPFAHLSRSAVRLGEASVTAATLVSAIGAASVAGRLLLGAAAARYRTTTLYLACYACAAASLIAWATADGFGQLLAFALVFGTGYGGYIALTPVLLAEWFGPLQLPRRLGVIYTAVGVGASAGPALTGYLVQAADSYTAAALVLAALCVAGLLVLLPAVRHGRHLRVPPRPHQPKEEKEEQCPRTTGTTPHVNRNRNRS